MLIATARTNLTPPPMREAQERTMSNTAGPRRTLVSNRPVLTPSAGEPLRDDVAGALTVVEVGTAATDHPGAAPAHHRGAGGARRVLAVVGELDIATAPRLRDQLQAMTGPGEDVVVDAQALTFVDVARSRALVAASAEQRRRGGALTVAGATPAVQRVLTLLGWSWLLASEARNDVARSR